MITLNFDSSEDHLATQKLLSVLGDDMFRFKEELVISGLPTSIQALDNIMGSPAGVLRDWSLNTTIPPDEGMELIDGEDGYLEDFQKEFQMIADSEGEIDLIIEMVVNPDTDAMNVSKAVVEILVDTILKIVHEGVNRNQDMILLNKLKLSLRHGKYESIYHKN